MKSSRFVAVVTVWPLVAAWPVAPALAQGGVMPSLPAGDSADARTFSIGHGNGGKGSTEAAAPAPLAQPHASTAASPGSQQGRAAPVVMKIGTSIGTKE